MAHFSILIPHYKTWKMTFYAIHQLLKHRGTHQLDIYVVDNNPSDGTANNLKFFGDQIRLFPYPAGRMQSHGIAYDWIIPQLRTELFITIESDSYPTQDGWLDWYEQLDRAHYDSGGSYLDLSGGSFVHTAGAFYKKSIWQKAKRYVDEVQYSYVPNIAMKDGFPCHLMVHKEVQDQFYNAAGSLVDLYKEYKEVDPDLLPLYIVKRVKEYEPIGRGVFHNGIGNRDESYLTYAQRNTFEEKKYILLDNSKPLIWRMGYEPGQYFHYWMTANGHNVYNIPTEVNWMPGWEQQQQASTVMQNGFTHLWAVTAYNDASDPALKDIIDYKKNMMEELYLSIPQKNRI